MINMTREYATKIACALDQVESFEVFMDIVEQAITKGEEICGDLHGFDEKLRGLMDEELAHRVKILEAM